jgi:hypothetical protein
MRGIAARRVPAESTRFVGGALDDDSFGPWSLHPALPISAIPHPPMSLATAASFMTALLA